MSLGSDRVKSWRKRNKLRMVQAMGGKCVCCGYAICVEAMEFHHLNPKEKDFTFSKKRSNVVGWSTLVVELRKCVLVCSNCHKEVHAGFRKIPTGCQQFDESFVEYRVSKEELDACPICNKQKPIHQKTCSSSCAAKKSCKVDWSKIDIFKLLEEGMSKSAIGDLLGVSDSAVHKRIKKLSRIPR